ncbi:hypothetical protein D3C81_1707360 [compost metagenome]
MIRSTERVINRWKKSTAHQIHKSQFLAIRFDYCSSKSWCSRWKVRRTHHPRLVIDEIKNFFIVPCMVSHSKSMNTLIEKLFSNFLCNTTACCRVLAISDNNMRIVF